MREINRDIVASIIESSDGYLLFGKSRKGGVYQGCWIIPGGGIDDGETREQALHREILEETGIDINTAQVKLLTDWRKGDAVKTLKETGEEVLVHMNFFDYLAVLQTTHQDTITAANDDLIELGWFAKSELKDLTLSPPTVELLKEIGYL